MNKRFYTSERNVQIVLALLKANKIKKIIASPGTTNFTFVASIQDDPYFEVYSAVDERSAAYMACGMAAESKEPVVLTCTGATASRDYYPGLTEAFYRKLPILAVTSHQGTDRIGQLWPQNIDRRQIPHDIAKLSEMRHLLSWKPIKLFLNSIIMVEDLYISTFSQHIARIFPLKSYLK